MGRITNLIALASTLAVAALPSVASADHWYDRHERRHEVRNQWKDLAITGGVVGLIGAATHNPGLAAVGALGGIYGGIRYEEDAPRGWRYGYDHRRDDDRRWDDRRDRDRRDGRHGW